MTTDNQHRWPYYRLDIAIYFGIVAALFWLTSDYAWSELRPWQFVMLGLAAYRIADVLANEEVSKAIRLPLRGHPHPGVQALCYLLCCPSCLGVWIATFLIFSLRAFPDETLVVAAIFALSACERFGAKAYNFLDKRD